MVNFDVFYHILKNAERVCTFCWNVLCHDFESKSSSKTGCVVISFVIVMDVTKKVKKILKNKRLKQILSAYKNGILYLDS